METTRAVVLTPPGRGAIAVVLVAGPKAAQFVAAVFRPANPRPWLELPVGKIAFGRWGTEPGEEVVVTKIAPQRIEIHCHGGVAAAQAICDSLQQQGAEILTWTAWLQLEAADPITATAQMALAAATTGKTAAILLDQAEGALGKACQRVLAALALEQVAVAETEISALLALAPVGLHLTSPFRVVLAGPPNVGKSSLINALLGFERAIVFDEPGTTRDVVRATTAFDGWPVELSDTAGLRESHDPIEQQGVARAQEQLRTADAVVLVFDATISWSDDCTQLVARWPNAVVVRNKSDLVNEPIAGPGMAISAKTSRGLAELQQVILQKLIPQAPPRGAAVPFTREQIEWLTAARQFLTANELPAAAAAVRRMLTRMNPATNS